MEKLLKMANDYIKTMDWKDITLVKLCVFFAGVALGSLVSPRNKKTVFFMALVIFVASYIPCMVKLVQFYLENNEDEFDEDEMMLFADYIPE
ncbi:MAG: permease of phosphate ABC transporter [Clostridia bacterium]|nr:permease of phosphate ABC transporter [Oscillospiraceae bacterium]MBQ2910853.1 permease of phosphate ABC transporter [Clostridia bacterium]MBQ6933267.1 permease of phosphate ABC transporter [Clostridia bacterium]